MIRIAICDDEKEILAEVSEQIRRYAVRENKQGMEIVCFDSASVLLGTLEDGSSFDIFVLDVYIGDDMGTALARDIRKRGCDSPIVFLTTSVEHAPESFETGTLRYLIKPLAPEKLYEAMDAAIAQCEKQQKRLIKLKTEGGIESINAAHVIYSEAHDHYQYIVLEDGRRLKARMTVADLYDVLLKYDGFIRVGSAYIINLRNVKNVTTSEVHLYNDFSIPIPRGKHAEIKRSFWNFHSDGEEG